ncbi:MAG: RNA-directed DNA polymerase [Oscillospiraceae bacterium]
MIDLSLENYRENARLLLRGLWYVELPDLLDMEELVGAVDDIFDEINSSAAPEFGQDADGFITELRGIVSPPYIRAPGVEAVSFFDFKKNKSLREMQIPNLLHYIAFMYNTLMEFGPLFEALYIDPANAHFVENSNSYLVFEEAFALYSYDGEEDWALAGTFTTKNNKINSSAILSENKRRMLAAEADYLYSLKMDIESFFPNLYTHNFEKMAAKPPFSAIGADFRYFRFLDQFHQRINNNQTKGIPAGTFSSHVAAELCMLCVDEEIRQFLQTRPSPVGYVRYVDDLTFFCDSEGELAALYPAVQSILNQYRLRINGNKTESIHAVYGSQPSYLTELEQEFPKLKLSEERQELLLSDFFALKKYVSGCLREGRSSQIRTLLSLLLRRMQGDKLGVADVADALFCYLLKLAFEDVTLASHVYRLLAFLLENSADREPLLRALRNKLPKVDAEYPDTLLQVWHYDVLFRYSDGAGKSAMISGFKQKHCNPLVAAAMVQPGKERNKELFRLIRDQYKQESGSTRWQSEIMYSKWWLPLFKLARYDSHDYDHFMKSNNFPKLLRLFPAHTEPPEGEEPF